MNATLTKDMESHLEAVRPGLPFRFTEAATIGDGVWQGDLGLEIVAAVPADYVKAKKKSRQLVPGNTRGSKHCLDSLDGVELFYAPAWPASAESLQGPAFVLTKERTVTHPVHGDVTIPAGFTVLCRYQREFDSELRRERRNAD